MWCLIIFFSTIALGVDSSICVIETENLEAFSLTLQEEIIDYELLDDTVYALTNRFIYKIDPFNLKILDHTFLPQRFNNLVISNSKIILISTNEIITLQREKLSYEGGIGIEIGDYKPIITPHFSDFLYLIEETGPKGRVKLFDLKGGKKAKQISLPPIIYYTWNGKSLVIGDINNQISWFDEGLNRRGQVKIPLKPEIIYPYWGGYLVFNKRGAYWFSRRGKLIDFQPLALKEIRDYGDFFFLTDEEIILFDTLTLRIRAIKKNSLNLNKLYNKKGYFIGVGNKKRIYIIKKEDLSFKEIPIKTVPLRELKPASEISLADSLYYIQIGAFYTFDHARKIYDSISVIGIPVFVDSLDYLYRVKIGGFLDKKGGIDFLENLGIMGWCVYQKAIERKDSIEFSINGGGYLFKNGIIYKKE